MIRTALAPLAAVLALTGCGAEYATTRASATPTTPTTPNKACQTPPPAPRTTTATPSQTLLDAFAVLRRPRTAEDALPKTAPLALAFTDGLMVDAARHVTLADGTDFWLLPVQNLAPRLKVSAACLRTLTPQQRKDTRKAIRDSRKQPPVEGVALIFGGDQPQLGMRYSTEDILAGRAFQLQGCTGAQHDQITLSGIVPDAVTRVTVVARGGAIEQADPEQNLVRLEQPRPDSAAGLPAHITSTTAGAPLEYALDPGITHGLDQPCEPPSNKSIGQRRTPPERLDKPAGARLELTTSRWQPEDTGPAVAGATYREKGGRCLLIGSEARLRAGTAAHRFCVADARLRSAPFVARATRLPGGDVVLEGFADPDRIAWITVEHSTLTSGAFRLPIARGSGAFFVAVHGRHARGGTFKLHAARRGAPVRYTGLTKITLPRTGG
ncbi:MAG TPA: hypothetical protein VNS09_22590 [Solirubrobacter sp.]|nr:hypothetical protein [Solirubrobacter sp.]